jgi:hypothetical protein
LHRLDELDGSNASIEVVVWQDNKMTIEEFVDDYDVPDRTLKSLIPDLWNTSDIELDEFEAKLELVVVGYNDFRVRCREERVEAI